MESEFEDGRQAVGTIDGGFVTTTVQRAIRHQKPHSFMTQLLSDDGSLTSAEWIELAEKGQLTDWFSQSKPIKFDV